MAGPERPRRRGIWVAVAALTALVVIPPVGVQTWGRLMVRTRTDDASYRHPITALEIDAPYAGVRVSPGPAGQVKIHSKLRWVSEKPRVRLSWDQDILRINVTCARWELFSSLDCGAGLDLRVPADIAMRAEVTSGAIDVRGLSGELRLGTTSGAVRMAGIRGRVWVRANSGAIVGTALSSPRVDAELISGDLQLGFAQSPRQVNAVATSGAVRIGLPLGEQYRVTGVSGNGPRRITPELVNGRSDRVIDVTTNSGAVSVGYPPPF